MAKPTLQAKRKVAAHQLDKDNQLVPGTAEHDQALGNDWADQEAKMAVVQGHPGWSPAETAVMHLQVADAKATIELAMQALKRWPQIGKLEKRGEVDDDTAKQLRAAQAARKALHRRAQQRAAREEARRAQATHAWCTWRQTKRCANCLAMASPKVEPCTGQHPLRLVVQKAQEQGHEVWAAAVTGTTSENVCCPMAICKKCGGWTFGSRQAKGLKLAVPCEPPTKVGLTTWARVCAGRHPKPDSTYKACRVTSLAPWPLEFGDCAPADEGLTHHHHTAHPPQAACSTGNRTEGDGSRRQYPSEAEQPGTAAQAEEQGTAASPPEGLGDGYGTQSREPEGFRPSMASGSHSNHRVAVDWCEPKPGLEEEPAAEESLLVGGFHAGYRMAVTQDENDLTSKKGGGNEESRAADSAWPIFQRCFTLG